MSRAPEDGSVVRKDTCKGNASEVRVAIHVAIPAKTRTLAARNHSRSSKEHYTISFEDDTNDVSSEQTVSKVKSSNGK